METQRWREKLLNSNWLNNNYEMDYTKITKCTEITDFINVGKVRYNVSRKSHTKHTALRVEEGRGELLDTELTD